MPLITEHGCSCCGEGTFTEEGSYCQKCKKHFKRVHSIKGVGDPSEPLWVRHCRAILLHGFSGVPHTVNGKTRIVLVDAFTASAVTQVYDQLNPENKTKFASLHFLQAVNLTWKLIKK